MKNPESQNKGNTLASLATLYPEAFAMATASNSRSGLAVRRWEIKSTTKLSLMATDHPVA